MSLETVYDEHIKHVDHVDENTETLIAPSDLLQLARDQSRAISLSYAGSVTPKAAWQVVKEGGAVLVDVRTTEERKFVGHVPDSLHVAWATGTSLTRNPRFVKELETRVGGKNTVVLLLCRSGHRSAAAAEAAHAAGFTNVFNVSEGFEGDLDDKGRRGHIGGWRYHDLPWVQD